MVSRSVWAFETVWSEGFTMFSAGAGNVVRDEADMQMATFRGFCGDECVEVHGKVEIVI